MMSGKVVRMEPEDKSIKNKTMRIIVEYNPNISKHAKRCIFSNITPSMSSNDEDSHQYPIDFVLEVLEEENEDELFNKDIELLRELMKEDVSYIEI